MNNVMIIVNSLAGGGAEKTAANLSKMLSEFFHVYIVVITDKIKYSYEGELHVLGDNNYSDLNKLGKLFAFLKWILQVRRLKKEKNIDCSISFLMDCDIINYFSKTGDKVIGSVRSNPRVEVRVGKWLYKIRKFLLKRMDVTVTPSDGVREDILLFYKLTQGRVITINNAYISSVSEESANSKISAGSTRDVNDVSTLITIGNLRYEKGQWHLLKVFSRVHKVIPDCRLILIGDGTYYSKLYKLTKDLNIDSNVEFAGHVDNPIQLLKSADVFLLTSISESFSNVILEAMFAGLPVVCADCDFGPREIICGENAASVKEPQFTEYGVLTPAFGVSEPDFSTEISKKEVQMAETIIRMLNDKNIREEYSKKSKSRINHYSYDKIKYEWKAIIDE